MNIIKKGIIAFSFFSIIIFIYPNTFLFFGKLGLILLLITMFIRPLSDIFTHIKIFKKILLLRKELGITCGIFILAHCIGYFLSLNLPIIYTIINKNFWNYTNFKLWGTLGIIALIPVLITSNHYSIKKLGRLWKHIQKFAYMFFIFGIIHIILSNPQRKIEMLLILSLYLITYIIAIIKKYKCKLNPTLF